MKLLIATRNSHKLKEIRQIFDIPSLELIGADEVPGLPDVEEDGDTFEKNAVKKAVTLAKESGMWALADDSGLVVDALNGEPGVYSARYAGEPADYEANNRKLLAEMQGKDLRSARFMCVIALSSPEGDAETVAGSCEGSIISEERGVEGFGYDPLFVPEGHDLTFAELDSSVKNSISHRGNALNKAWDAWHDTLSGE